MKNDKDGFSPQIWTDQLGRATTGILSGFSLPRTLQRISEAAKELSGAKYAALGVPAQDGTMRTFVTSGLTKERAGKIEHQPVGIGLLGAILDSDEPIRLDNIQDDPRSAGFCQNHPQMTSFLGVPIIGRDHERLGNLYLSDKNDGTLFTDEDERLLQLLASFAAIAIENANLHNQLQTSAIDSERDRIAMEMHDGVIQLVYAVGMKLEIIRGNTELESEEDKRFMTVFEDLNTIIEDLRGYIHDLQTSSEGKNSLTQRLRNIAKHFKDFSNVDVIFDMPAELPKLSESQRHSVLQIIREALANVARHANASYVKINIHASDKKLHVAIQDDGVGFDTANVKETGHFGLYNLQQRAQGLGGKLTIESQLNKGTTVYLVVPLVIGKF